LLQSQKFVTPFLHQDHFNKLIKMRLLQLMRGHLNAWQIPPKSHLVAELRLL